MSSFLHLKTAISCNPVWLYDMAAQVKKSAATGYHSDGATDTRYHTHSPEKYRKHENMLNVSY